MVILFEIPGLNIYEHLTNIINIINLHMLEHMPRVLWFDVPLRPNISSERWSPEKIPDPGVWRRGTGARYTAMPGVYRLYGLPNIRGD